MLNCQENKNTILPMFVSSKSSSYAIQIQKHFQPNSININEVTSSQQIILKKHDLVSIKYGWQSNLFNGTNTLQTVTHNSHAGIRKDVRHEHMTHKAMKWCITKVPTRPAMFPCHKTASKICTILWKGFSFVKFSV